MTRFYVAILAWRDPRRMSQQAKLSMRGIAVLALTAKLATSLTGPMDATAALIDLGTLGGNYSGALGINSAGQVAGYSATATGDHHAFLWSGGVMTDLGTLGGNLSVAYAINDAGQVAGVSATATGDHHAFLWSGGVMTDLGTLGGSYSTGTGINSAGQVAGYSATVTGDHYGHIYAHAFLWSGGVMTDLGTLGGSYSESFPTALNAAGQVVGWSDTASYDKHAFLWSGGVMTDLGTLDAGEGFRSRPSAVNAAGQVVGWSDTDAPFPQSRGGHAFLWSGGVMTDLGTLGGNLSAATAINDAGQVAGYSGATDTGGTAFLWSGGVMTDLGTLAGSYNIEPVAINAFGEVAGTAFSFNDPFNRYYNRAFRWRAGVMTDLGTLGGGIGDSSWATVMNDAGQVAGASNTATGQYHAFITGADETVEICGGSNQMRLHAGDRVTVTVRMDTSNPAEDQGNVKLQLKSGQTGELLNPEVSQFGQSTQFTYINQREGDQVFAQWDGPTNGDESCALTVSMMGPHNALTYEHKAQAYYESASAIPATAIGAAGIAVCHTPAGLIMCPPPARAVFISTTAAGAASYSLANEIADDPPDANYSEVVIAVDPPPLPPGYPVAPEGGVSPQAAQAVNELGMSGAKLAAYSIAAQRTIQKLAGAHRAGDEPWAAQQRNALRLYGQRLADLIPAHVVRLSAARASLETGGFQPFPLSPGDLDAAKQQVAAAGLPPEVAQWLLGLGATQSAIDSAVRAVGTVDSSAAAGAFPEVIARPDTLAATLAFAAQFSAPGPLMCYKARLTPGTSSWSSPLTIADRFGVATFNAKSPSVVCNIAGLDNVDDQLTAPFDDTHHLVGHALSPEVRGAPAPGLGTTHAISNRFQTGIHVTLLKESHLLIASAAKMGDQGTTAEIGPFLDDFKCFKVRSADAPRYIRGDGTFGDVRDQAAELGLIVGKPRYLCIPASIGASQPVVRAGALTCYDAKPCRTCQKGRFASRNASQSVANDVIGNAVIRLKATAELCIPSVLDPGLVGIAPTAATSAQRRPA